MSYQATEDTEETNAYYSTKETNLKRLHTIPFQLHDLLKKAK